MIMVYINYYRQLLFTLYDRLLWGLGSRISFFTRTKTKPHLQFSMCYYMVLLLGQERLQIMIILRMKKGIVYNPH